MTGRDLLDAIGHVDDELLERCQETEQKTSQNKISRFWYGRKFIPMDACACLLIMFILGFTYWRYDFSDMEDTLVSEDTREMEVLPGNGLSDETERLSGTDEGDGADGDILKEPERDLAEDTADGADQNADEGLTDSLPDDGSPADNGNPAGDNGNPAGDGGNPAGDGNPTGDGNPGDGGWPGSAFGTPGGTKPVPGNSGNIKEPGSPGNTETPVTPPNPGNTETPVTPPNPGNAETPGGESPGYSRGIKIKPAEKFPQGNEHTGNKKPSGDSKNPNKMISAKKILAEHTAIIRGTVQKIERCHAVGGKVDVYFSVISMKVKETYRADGKGNPQKGAVCKIYLPYKKNDDGAGANICGKITKGSEAVIMPYIADAGSGIRKKEEFFAYLDVADYYMDAETAESHIFLKQKSGICYDAKIYDIPCKGKKVTLNDVGDYIRKHIRREVNAKHFY